MTVNRGRVRIEVEVCLVVRSLERFCEQAMDEMVESGMKNE